LADPGSIDSQPAPAQAAAERPGRPVGNPILAAVLAFLIPGLGHLYLRRWRRGLAFCLLILIALWVGVALQGNLYRVMPNDPLSILGTLGAMGAGIPYFVLRYTMRYTGDILSPGFEYGTAFLLTAGLMNWLLVLDVLDISRGKKE
jgi:uncharacterized protein involved in response to NO